MPSRHAERPARARGFTLIELVAALTLSALLIGGAWRALSQLEGVRSATAARREQDDAAANGLRLLRSVVLRAEAGPTDSLRFAGDSQRARFRSWCDTPGGWLTPCLVSLEIATVGDTSDVLFRQGVAAALRLWRTRGPIKFRYVDSPRHDRSDDRWTEGITPPSAIAIASRADTLVLRVGAAP